MNNNSILPNRIAKFLLLIQVALFFVPVYSNAQTQTNTLPGWAFGGFVRPQNINPIISPDTSAAFIDPMTGKKVEWESDNTFNPGAIIKDGKVIVLYRAEDNFGNGNWVTHFKNRLRRKH